jgi:hypothetical protein
MNTSGKPPEDPRIIDLEAKLKEAERKIAELREERDESRELVSRMEEHVSDSRELIEQWVYAFDMTLDDDGKYRIRSQHLIDQWSDLVEKYQSLVKEWNSFVPDYNATVSKNPVGRPLDASEAQVATVRKLRAKGMSIRNIMTETNLTMQTVRTIISKDTWSDRASKRHLEKIDFKPIRDLAVNARARKRTRDALPKKIAEALDDGAKLLKEAKGIG